jgi:Secretion system C-terminal sorting domain
MKSIFIRVTILLFIAYSNPISAQIHENSQVFGLNAVAKVLREMPNSAWFVAGESTPFGAKDSLYILVYNSDAQVTLRKTLKVPSGERHYIHDALVLNDGGFLIAFESTLCDVVGDQTVLQKLEANGDLAWEKISNWGESNALPHKLMLTPDGNVIGHRDGRFSKIDTQNGDVLWTKNVVDQIGGDYIFDCALLRNTEDILVTINTFLITLVKEGTPTNFNYVVSNNFNFEPNYPGIIRQTDNWIYTFNAYFNFLARTNSSGVIDSFPVSGEQIFDFTTKNNQLFWIGRRNNGQNIAQKTDEQGLVLEEFPIADQYLCGQKIASNGGSIAIAGYDGYGPESMLSGEYNPYYDVVHSWLRIQKGTNTQITTNNADASITKVIQNTEVESLPFGDPPNVYYNYIGGDFQVEITNNSQQTLQNVYVNIRHGFNYFSAPCLNRPGTQYYYPNLNLAPGASVLVPFGDILAYGQEAEANNFCFFTSSPNHVPDRNHENDWLCKQINTATNTPIVENLLIAPNPVLDVCTVTLKEEMLNANWRLYDVQGRLVGNGKSDFSKNLEISLELLDNGVYFLRIKDSIGRIVVAR